MSVIFGETPERAPRESALNATDSAGELAASLPLTITLWAYFDQAPGASETHTLFWYGDSGSQANHLFLEATQNTGVGGVDITAKLRGSTGSVSVTATALPTAEWIMLTVIVAEEGGASHRTTLSVNDSQAASSPANVGTVSPGAYDTFLLGATEGGSNYGQFRAEHVAIWEPDEGEPLSAADIEELFEERWAPFAYTGGPSPPLGRLPGIAYWMLVGHWAAGIDANDGQNGRDNGLLFNEANPAGVTAKPQLTMLDTSKPVLWSAKTPVMRYAISQDLSPGPLVRPPIPPVSRLQPHFYVFNTSGPLGTFKYGPLEIPVYTHPNFIPKGISHASGANGITPLVSTLTEYFPQSDVALLAKRVADFMEFTGLKGGIGTVGDGLYEGWVILLGIGLGDAKGLDLHGFRGTLVTSEDPETPFTGTDNAVPLDIHPLDSVEHDEDRPNRPWHTWFNAHGRRLVKDHMDGFWTALKRELDERNLCYPRTLWWDQEDWARPTQAVRNLPGGVARGTFTLQLADARAATEQLMDSPTHGTLDEIWTATGPGYQDAQDVTSVANRAFLNWYLGWSIAIGQQAMRDAMMAKAKELFPLAVWSNYDCFSADNPDFRYVGGTPRLGYYNTPPADQATMHGDYSSPKLYTPGNLYGMVNTPGRLAPEMGVTFPQVMRNIHKSRIDACTNAFTAKPVTPHFETGLKRWAAEGGSDPQVFYKLTSEDVFDIMGHAWKRGVNDFIAFVFEQTLAADEDDPDDYETDAGDDERKLAHDRMYEVCLRLLNTVHWMPQESHARAARVSRRGW